MATSLQIGLLVAQGCCLAGLLLVLCGLRRQRRELDALRPTPERLAAVLKPTLEAVAAERERTLAQLGEQLAGVEQMACDLKTLKRRAERARQGEPIGPREEDAQRSRDEARRLLAAGGDLDTICERTGVPRGELQVLAGLLAARA